MGKPSGLWVAIGGGPRADNVAASIERNATFSTTVTTSEVGPRSAELAVVSLRGTDVDYLGISQARRNVATDQTVIVISNLVALGPLSADQVRSKAASSVRGALRSPFHRRGSADAPPVGGDSQGDRGHAA